MQQARERSTATSHRDQATDEVTIMPSTHVSPVVVWSNIRYFEELE